MQLLARVELLVALLVRAEADRFLVAEAEHAERREALVEELVHAVLECAVEVDHDVAAHDDVELVEGPVGHEVVLREHHVLGQRALELRAVVLGEVVLGERLCPARLDVVLRVLAHLVEREHARSRSIEHRLVDVGRVDPRPLVDTLLLQEDRQGVDLLTRRAPGDPDAGERVGPEERHDPLPECDVERRIAEHRRDVDRQVEEETLHAGGVVQELLLERGDRLEAFRMHASPDSSPQRGWRVLTEVEAVVAEDSFEQK